MKARVKETGEIIDVKLLRPVIYSRLNCNGKVFEEYDEDELELIIPPRPKMVSLDKACEWLLNNIRYYSTNALGAEYMCNDFREAMEAEK